MSVHVHVVSHTHWDREWYQPAERFRQRLVALIDELLDRPLPSGVSFLLDGQTIVLDDYLSVRPERRADLERALADGRVESGPWYVLADELIPGGEALVRNLLQGRRTLQSAGASSPPVLYCPDSFGHPAALPTIAKGFGLDLIILWRGFGSARWPAADLVRWRAPGGDEALVYHLARDGYELGSSLPIDRAEADERWGRVRAALTERNRSGVALLPNGADHHAIQRQAVDAVQVLRAAAGGDTVAHSSLTSFARDVIARTHADAPVITGELRDSYGYTWTLQGTFATRARQKRANAAVERGLVREAEPWSALARAAGAASRTALVQAAWRSLLQAHPHDTLCGCSIDDVARAADVRTAAARAEASGIRDDAIADLIGYDGDDSRSLRDRWSPVLLLRNAAPRERSGVVLCHVDELLADEPVGPGSRPAMLDPSASAADAPLPVIEGARAVQMLDRAVVRDRIEPRRAYPDNDLVRRSTMAIWMDDVPPLGVSAHPIRGTDGKRPRRRLPDRVRARRGAIENGAVSIELADNGALWLRQRAGDRMIRPLLTLETAPDRGDLYTPSIGAPAIALDTVRARVTRRGPLVGEIELRWVIPAGVEIDRDLRDTLKGMTATLSLHAASPLVRIEVRGDNRARDHRLRLGVATDVLHGETWADAAFATVRRQPIAVSPEERVVEAPPPTAPLHRYVSVYDADRGATLYGDGLAEYESDVYGHVFVTLLRAVGELSRSDLPERPGHAGWPVSTPEAQSIGPFAARFALLLHGRRDAATIDAVERAADDVLVPVVGRTVRDAVDVARSVIGVTLEGIALTLSAVKESDDGECLVLRCVNRSDETQAGRWTLPWTVREAWTARLDETRTGPSARDGNTIAFSAQAGAVVTILVAWP